MATVKENLRSSRLRMPILLGIGVLFLALMSANGIARTYTDWLWFDNLEIGGVWTTIIATQVVLALVFGLVFFALLWGNLYVADRLAPTVLPVGPEEDLLERYQQLVGNRGGKLRLAISAAFALIAGGNTVSQWQEWLLFRNGGTFDMADPVFGRDPGFYMFTLPLINFVVDWLFAALVLTLIVVSVAHYLNGGIRASVPTERVSSGVKLHLSVLMAALAVVRAVAYWLDRFALLTTARGDWTGALATDVNIQRPALNLLALISLFGAALFLANVRRQGWGLPMVAIGLWLVSHIFVGNIYPALYQRLRVEPQATTSEAEFVARNIEATRFAYGLDSSRLRIEQFEYSPGLSSAELDEYADVLDNVPLVDPELARDSFTRSQGERAFYEFADRLDVDRYMIDGQLRPVVLSARGLNLGVNEVPQNWETQHIVFTHGYGAAMAAGWEVDRSGRPRFLVRDLGDVAIDESLSETLGQPRAYFGERFGGYSIVNAERNEVDYQTRENESRQTRYQGDGGVGMGSLVRRLAFALRFRELDPLISADVTSQSEAIYIRDVATRVQTVAPFLSFDSNPYPVLANDQMYWVVDGYTTSSDFPYSQDVRTSLQGSSLTRGYNYVRNSVKAVVDAYNGDVTLYVIDDNDPVLNAWVSAFPELFTDADEIPPEIRDNLRYPEDIFQVQTDMWSTYVVTDPVQAIQRDVAWSVAAQPRTEAQVGETDTAGSATVMDPQYLITRLPGSDKAEFVLQRAFIPSSGQAGSTTARPELTAVMLARSDPENYGELVLYEIPGGEVEAPDFVHAEIRKNDELTEFLKEKIGSVVSFGEMTLLLVDDTIVYVRPVYVQAASGTAVPELSRVIAVNGDRIAMGETLDEALRGITTDSAPGDDVAEPPDEVVEATGDGTDNDPEDPDASTPPGQGVDFGELYDSSGKSVATILADIEDILVTADLAEEAGNPEEAAKLRAQARQAVTAVVDLLGSPVAASAGG